jgi:hypothetical protein
MEEAIVRGKKLIVVVAVEPLENYLLKVTLSDGRKGLFDMKPYLNSDFFQELKIPAYFRGAFIENGSVAWPHEQDIAPETIEYELQPEPLNV